MTCELFEASKLKIRRAQYHAQNLHDEIVEFLKRDPIAIVVEKGKDPKDFTERIRIREEVPKNFAPIIGDVIHNLRAALDLLACELVRLNHQSDKDVLFPFAGSKADLEEMIKRRNMHLAAPQAVDLIRKLAPYKGGNVVLRALHDLDIADKHKALIPTLAMLSMPGTPLIGNDAGMVPIRNFVKDGQVIACGHATTNLEAGMKLQANFHLVFPYDEPLGGDEVIPTLHSLVNLVEGIVESFEALEY